MSFMSESLWWYLFLKKVKSWDSTTWLEFYNFKPRLKSNIFNCISGLDSSLLGGRCSVLFGRGSQDLFIMAPMPPVNSRALFCLHVYGLWPSYWSRRIFKTVHREDPRLWSKLPKEGSSTIPQMLISSAYDCENALTIYPEGYKVKVVMFKKFWGSFSLYHKYQYC